MDSPLGGRTAAFFPDGRKAPSSINRTRSSTCTGKLTPDRRAQSNQHRRQIPEGGLDIGIGADRALGGGAAGRAGTSGSIREFFYITKEVGLKGTGPRS